MSEEDAVIPFDRSLNAGSNTMQTVSPLVRRLIANNGGPYTFTGTCTYVVGHGAVSVIDPGPSDQHHLQALLAALNGETVARIVVTHTHRDHSPGAIALRAATGAPIVGCAPYRPGPPTPAIDLRASDASHDLHYEPDRVLADGEGVTGEGYDLIAVATPGHASNHMAYALPQEKTLFSGDHVMAWSTTVVAPPDGSMRAYMASLDKLQLRDEDVYWPGHGGPVRNPRRFVKALAQHRRHRESAILRRLGEGDTGVDTLVARLYSDLAPSLKGAAALSILAHLQDLGERGLVRIDGALGPKARFFLG
jgi:glyoxylase-like metal-dependent hydrolase (beta-lactamase superfamily II)